MRNLLRPYVIREAAPDGKTWHGYGDRPCRFFTAMGARRRAAQLAVTYAEANADRARPRYRFTVRFKASPVGGERR